MNDDFLHRIRVEPRLDFMTSLKARLDRQLPLEAPAPRRSLFRVLAFGLLFGGSVFAISLLTVNGIPDFARSRVQTGHPDSTTGATGPAHEVTRSPAHAPSTPERRGQSPAEPSSTAGAQSSAPGSTTGLSTTAVPGPANNTTPSIAGAAPTGQRQVVGLITPKSLQTYMGWAVDYFGRRSSVGISMTTTDTAAEALAQLCAGGGRDKDKFVLGVASVSRRITRAEFEVCTRNLGNISEVSLANQAVVLARSTLYGTLALSPRDLFLALAAEIPDPEHPEIFISNPHRTWARVNAALEDEAIEVFGPPAQSTTDIAFREILLEAGCNSFPTIAALKQSDTARYERVCRTLRKDGVYTELREPEVAFDAFQRLQSHPNVIGVLAYGMFQSFGFYPQNGETVAASPIGGVAPTRETISAGTYPGSRPLYLYVDQRRTYGMAPDLVALLLEAGRVDARDPAVLPPSAAQIEAIRNSRPRLPDLKL